MLVKELIEELQKWPPDMPIATLNDINPEDIPDPHWIKVSKCTWVHGNWPCNKPDFDYINLE